MGNVETRVDWKIACFWCEESFLVSDAKRVEGNDDFVICPKCSGWSGYEMRKRRPQLEARNIEDPGQHKLVSDLWAWIVVDPATNLESLCGILVDGCPKVAISSNLNEALRLSRHIKELKTKTGKQLRLVRYVKHAVEMEL